MSFAHSVQNAKVGCRIDHRHPVTTDKTLNGSGSHRVQEARAFYCLFFVFDF